MQKKFQYIAPKNGYPEWNNNPDIFQLNSMDAHTTLMPFSSAKEALIGVKVKSPYYYSLNGNWKFSFAKTPQERLKDFYRSDYDCSDWDELKVPGHWQLQGYDYPQYINVRYPWVNTEPLSPPFAPTTYNPVGSYVTFFDVPENFQGNPIYISFQGVESAFYVWINGELVGYSEDTFTPSEFDITPYLLDGTNKLAVEVYRWCDASWLEDQDFWRLSGIFRDVYLYSTPAAHIYDYCVVTELDQEYRDSILKLDLTISNYFEKPFGNLFVEAELYDSNEHKTLSTPLILKGNIMSVSSTNLNGEVFVPNPLKWSAEHPNLYTLVLSLKDENGSLLEVVSCKIGFRTFEIKDGLMRINGERIVFKGVNRHEFSQDKGRAIGYDEMLKDIMLMKAYNINAVRTSHYPNNEIWYELCDQYGIYVIDETNLETHGSWKYNTPEEEPGFVPGSKPEWTNAVIDRCNSMLQRDKNHPSIVIWSLGNESWGGDNFIKMHDYLKEQDSTRVIHYEGVFNARAWDCASDIESRMYSKPYELEEYATNDPKKPFLLCEYSHAMGNSCGDLSSYCELFDKYPILQGGFIWDWIDQAIRTKTSEGIEYLAYGGDFNEPAHDSNFCGNGLIFADRTVSPKLYEVKKCYQNVRVNAINLETGALRLTNHFLFTNLNEYKLVWEITKNGIVVLEGSCTPEVEPNSSTEVNLNYKMPEETTTEDEFILTVSLRTILDNPWSTKGHEIAYEQFILPIKNVSPVITHPEITQQNKLDLSEDNEKICIRGCDFIVEFSKSNGTMYSYLYKNVALIKAAPVPNFWRATTDNDRGNGLPERCSVWREASENRKLVSITSNVLENHIDIVVNYLLEAVSNSTCKISYSISKDGEIRITEALLPGENLPEIPEFGMMLIMDKAFEHISWYGKGPHENYWDRSTGAKVGIYHGNVTKQITPYLKPQECGNKTEVRWAALTNSEGIGLLMKGIPFVEVNALPYTPFQLEAYDHQYKLPISENVSLRINYKQMGVGGDDSWGSRTHTEFTLNSDKPYEYSYLLGGCELKRD